MSSGEPPAPGKPRARFGLRFAPHVLVLPLTLVAATPAIRGTLVSFVHWWWSDSFREVSFVMDEARPNDGSPYIAGHFEGETDQHNIVGVMLGDTMLVAAAPTTAFAPGRQLPVWHSPAAPNFLAFGQEVNDVPVASMPVRPGGRDLLFYGSWFAGMLLAGLVLMLWVGKRWTRTWGTLEVRRDPRVVP